MPTLKITGEWDEPIAPDESRIVDALVQEGVHDIEIDLDSDDNPHGWGQG